MKSKTVNIVPVPDSKKGDIEYRVFCGDFCGYIRKIQRYSSTVYRLYSKERKYINAFPLLVELKRYLKNNHAKYCTAPASSLPSFDSGFYPTPSKLAALSIGMPKDHHLDACMSSGYAILMGVDGKKSGAIQGRIRQMGRVILLTLLLREQGRMLK